MIEKYNSILKEKNLLNQKMQILKGKFESQKLGMRSLSQINKALKRENDILTGKINDYLKNHLPSNKDNMSKLNEEKQKFMLAQNSELEKEINELREVNDKKTKDIIFYNEIIKNLNGEIANLKDEMDKINQNKSSLNLSNFNKDEYFKKLVKMMEQEIKKLKKSNFESDKKNKLLTTEFYNLSKNDKDKSQKIKTLINDKKFLQDHLNFYKVKNNELKTNLGNIEKLLLLNPKNGKKLNQFKTSQGQETLEKIFWGKHSRARSLPNKKKANAQPPVNVYINNHILEGQNKEQGIQVISGKTNSGGSKRTLKNRFSMDIWNNSFRE
jgi:chromosome segregation ATPase